MKQMQKSFPRISYKKKQGTTTPHHFEYVCLAEHIQKLREIDDHDPTLLHRIDFYALIFNLGNSFKHKIDFKEYTLEKGEVLLISPGQVHAFELAQEGEGAIMLFTEYFLTHYIAPKPLQEIRPLLNYYFGVRAKIDFHQHVDLIDTIKKRIQEPSKIGLDLLFGIDMTRFLMEWLLSEPKKVVTDLEIYQSFEAFKNLVEQEHHLSRDVQYFAKSLGLTYKKLNEACQQTIQQTPKALIDQIVIMQAKRIMASSQLPTKELAYQMGFDSPTNFVKYFKKHTGISPKQFLTHLKD